MKFNLRKFFLILLVLIIIFAFSLMVLAVSTQFFITEGATDFMEGELHHLSISEDGYLFPGPANELLFESEEAFLLSLARDGQGFLYAGSANNGIIYRIHSKTGDSEKIFKSDNVMVQDIVIDSQNRLYAAINPDGKIISIPFNGQPTLIVQLDENYIWDLLMVDDKLYAACGNPAQIYEIQPNGSKTLLYETDEEIHFMCLAYNDQNLFFGGEGRGILYQMDLVTGNILSLMDTYENEITAITIDHQDRIIIATGTPQAVSPPNNMNYRDSFSWRNEDDDEESNGQDNKSVKNSVYRISGVQQYEKLLTCNSTKFYSLHITTDNHILAAGGDEKGIVYSIAPDNRVAIFIQTEEEAVLSLLSDAESTFYYSTGNMGKIFHADLLENREGWVISEVLESPTTAQWGRIQWEADSQAAGITLSTRTGDTQDPGDYWSNWSVEYTQPDGNQITSPPNKYIQFKAILHCENGVCPYLKSVVIPYLPANQKPRITAISSDIETTDLSIIGDLTQSRDSTVTLSWEAEDDDDDEMIFSIFYKRTNANQWILLSDEIEELEYTFDSRRLLDGHYYFKVIAEDSPYNWDQTERSGFRISESMVIDNTPPIIQNLIVDQEQTPQQINALLIDEISNIRAAEYSMNGGEWLYIPAEDGMFDSRQESIQIPITRNSNELVMGTNYLVIRVMDSYENLASRSITFDYTF